MIAIKGFDGRTVGVFGLARSGLSAAHALVDGGARVFAWDDKPSARAGAPAGATLETWERWPWSEIGTLILSPGVPLTHPTPHAIVERARQAGADIIGDVELFAQVVRPAREAPGLAPVIAVTGTNGKSTTTALIGHILRSCGFDAQVGGNIGQPVLELAPPGAKTVYALEVSSYQIDLSPGLVPDVGVLTNLSPDHIDRHGTMENYTAVKAGLLARTARHGHAVIGIDDAPSAAIHTKVMAQGIETVPVSVGKVLGRGIFVIDGQLYDAWDQPATPVADLNTAGHLPGAHNWQNAALAYGAVRRIVRDSSAIVDAIMRFPGLAHRMEEVGRIGTVRFINDSKATNADAAARALACYENIFWIAGGKPKEGGIADLAPYFPRMRGAYLIGEAADAFGQVLVGKVETHQCGALDRALVEAYAAARNSGLAEPVVLLSPACASFDQFRDFEHRGDVFRTAVQALIASTSAPAGVHA